MPTDSHEFEVLVAECGLEDGGPVTPRGEIIPEGSNAGADKQQLEHDEEKNKGENEGEEDEEQHALAERRQEIGSHGTGYVEV